MQRAYFVLLIILAVSAVGLGFSKAQQINKLNPVVKIPVPTPTPPPSADVNIVVLSPRDNQRVSSPFLVMGRARVFENVVSIRLLDGSGNVLKNLTTTANPTTIGELGDFQVYVDYKTRSKSGILEIYQVSAKDGSEIDKVKTKVVFK